MKNRNNMPCRRPRIFAAAATSTILLVVSLANGFLHLHPAFVSRTLPSSRTTTTSTSTSLFMVYAPPGSGYASAADEVSELPDSYEPMMEYPGTMRPGRTPENAPFQDLPLGDEYSDRDPMPWPHFQQIEWHHRWDPPHPHPVPMEEFIAQQGRWATPEQEAQMRAGSRRASKSRRDLEQANNKNNRGGGPDMPILDDDDDDDLVDLDLPQDLGEGVFGNLGSTEDQKITAAATLPDETERATASSATFDGEDDVDTDDPGLEDFLLDLGLDSLGDDKEEGVVEEDEDIVGVTDAVASSTQGTSPTPTATGTPTLRQGLEDVVIAEDDEDDALVDDDRDTDSPDVTASIDVDDDDDLDLGLDDDDLSDDSDVPLEDLEEDDALGEDNFFDDGGFDYDDGDFGDSDFDGL